MEKLVIFVVKFSVKHAADLFIVMRLSGTEECWQHWFQLNELYQKINILLDQQFLQTVYDLPHVGVSGYFSYLTVSNCYEFV